MKKRPDGFLGNNKIDHKSEPFDYISELHDYLWRFVRCTFPAASGKPCELFRHCHPTRRTED